MNVGVDARCLMSRELTGVGQYTRNLLDAVFKIDKTNQYYLFYNSLQNVLQNIPQWDQDNIHYVYTRWPNKLLNLLLWLKLIKLDHLIIKNCLKIKNSKLKINIWFSPNLNFTHLSLHFKHIQTIHDLSFEFLPWCFTLKQRLWHWFLNPRKQCQKAEIILTPSENTRRDVCEVYKVETHCNASVPKVIKLMPGVSSDFGLRTTDYGTKVKEKYFLYLGTLEPRKNVEAVIEAYKELRYKIQDTPRHELGSNARYKLVIAGGKGWKNKKLLKLIQETSGVKYSVYVGETEKQVLYSQASLFVFPSLYEGFGLPVLEAMAAGVPVITSNRSSLPEVVGEAGYLVNPRNVAEIAEAMNVILKNQELRIKIIERQKERVKMFSWQKSAEEFVKLLV